MSTTKQRAMWSAGSAIVSVIMTCIIGTTYISSQIKANTERISKQERESDLKFCEVVQLGLRNDPRNGPPPSTPRGIDQQKEQIESFDAGLRLYDELECPDPITSNK